MSFGNLKGKAAIAVTATPQRIEFTDLDVPKTMRMSDTDIAKAVYYRYDPDSPVALFLGASETILRALGASKLRPGEVVIIPPGTSFLDLVCITSATATVYIDAGEQRALALS